MSAAKLLAPAKVNLYLAVRPERRPDGFHELETIFQAIGLADVVTITARPAGLECHCPALPLTPQENLAFRAAQLLLRSARCRSGAYIEIAKRIPAGAGLGGGSSDAAATLVGLNDLLGLNLSPEKLEQLAAQLGSDVPFFLRGGRQLGRGRGELLHPLPAGPELWLVLCFAGEGLPTAEVYREFDAQPDHPPFGAGEALQRLAAPASAAQALYNSLQPAVERLRPDVRRLRLRLEDLAGRRAIVSGAGNAVFTLLPSPDEAAQLARAAARRLAARTLVARTVTHGVRPIDGSPAQ